MGNLVMADKGFLIKDQLARVGVRLAMPHFLSHKGQFSPQECELNKKDASLRIHVERYVERLKNWHFFDRVIPISWPILHRTYGLLLLVCPIFCLQ